MASIEEKELEDFLMEDPDNLVHIGIELSKNAKVYRQLSLGNYGRADIVCIDPSPGPDGHFWFNVHIVELKKDQIDVNTLVQACRYLVGLRHHLRNSTAQREGLSHKFHYEITIVGSGFNATDWIYLSNIANFRAYTYDLSLSHGISFDRADMENYCLSKPEFSKEFETLLNTWRNDYVRESDEFRSRVVQLPAPEKPSQDAEMAA